MSKARMPGWHGKGRARYDPVAGKGPGSRLLPPVVITLLLMLRPISHTHRRNTDIHEPQPLTRLGSNLSTPTMFIADRSSRCSR
jgi:hypothetical protein